MTQITQNKEKIKGHEYFLKILQFSLNWHKKMIISEHMFTMGLGLEISRNCISFLLLFLSDSLWTSWSLYFYPISSPRLQHFSTQLSNQMSGQICKDERQKQMKFISSACQQLMESPRTCYCGISVCHGFHEAVKQQQSSVRGLFRFVARLRSFLSTASPTPTTLCRYLDDILYDDI